MDCTTLAHEFRTSLGFKLFDVILTKEQSVLTKIMTSFEGGNIQTQQMFVVIELAYISMTISSQ